MSTRIAPAINVIATIAVVLLTMGVPFAGIALSAVLTVANWKNPPWRTTYLVLTAAMVLLYLLLFPGSSRSS